MLGIYFFFKGYAKATVKGQLKEKIINRCIRNGVFMWNIKGADDGFSFNIRSCDMEKVRAAAGDAELVFSDEWGLPYIVGRFKKRYALTFGALLFVFGLIFLSSLVWKINITGCEITDSDNIVRILNECDVRKWVPGGRIDEDYIETRVMNGLDTLSWINVELKGTNLNIRVKERRAKPDVVDNEPTDLVASKDGVIYALRVKNGEEAVAIGDTVIKGQLLVSSLVYRDGDYILEHPYTVHSRGEVIARTWYTFDIEQPLSVKICEYTGKKYKRKRICLWGFDINLYFKDIPYENYETETAGYGRGFRFENETVREVRCTDMVYTRSEAVEMAVDKARLQLPDNIITSECITKDVDFKGDTAKLHIVFECTENIAVEKQYNERRETIDDSENSEIQ